MKEYIYLIICVIISYSPSYMIINPQHILDPIAALYTFVNTYCGIDFFLNLIEYFYYTNIG